MNKILRFQQRFSGLSGSSAFTLTELLVAALLTSSALMMSGIGLSAVISSSASVNESAERQDELNRALDFIAAEIREARTINQGNAPTNNFLDSVDPSEVNEASVRPILWLNMGEDEIVYYSAEPHNPSGPWQGDKVVYRWGPKFDSDGRQDNDDYEHHVLVDSLSSDQAVTTCPNAWTRSPEAPDEAQALGFYACIEPETKRVANLFQVGQVNRSPSLSKPLLKERQVFSRASIISDSLNGSSLFPDDGLSGGEGSDPGNGSLTFLDPDDEELRENDPLPPSPDGFEVLQDSNITFEPKGGEITCGDVDVATLTYVEFNLPEGSSLNPSVERVEGSGTSPQESVIDGRPVLLANTGSTIIRNIPSGTFVNFQAARGANNCGSYTVNTREHTGSQIIALNDGERLPYYTPHRNQRTIESFLVDILNGDQVSIGSNQKVFLFEIGEDFSDSPTSAYDFQDIVLLADVRPRSISATSSTSQASSSTQTSSSSQSSN